MTDQAQARIDIAHGSTNFVINAPDTLVRSFELAYAKAFEKHEQLDVMLFGDDNSGNPFCTAIYLNRSSQLLFQYAGRDFPKADPHILEAMLEGVENQALLLLPRGDPSEEELAALYQ